MPRGYRYIVTAVVGWLILTAAQPVSSAPKDGGRSQASYSESDAKQAADTIAGAIDNTVRPAEKDKGCDKIAEKRDSDLCAQWKAADAASDAARYAKWSVWVGLGGIAGLFVTLWFNFQAWKQARASKADTDKALDAANKSAIAATRLADTAEKTSRAQLRAYLDFDGVTIDAPYEYSLDEGPRTKNVVLSFRVKNFGQTPANHLTFTTNNYLQVGDERHSFTPEDVIDYDSVAPHDTSTHNAHWKMPMEYWSAIESKKLKLIVSLIVTYTDAFGEPRLLRSDYETLDVKKELGFVRGTRKAT